MALPITITGITRSTGHNPPVKSSAGNFYIVERASAGDLAVFKATDPTVSWTQQDSADRPSGPTIFIISSVQDGDILHIATSVGSSGYEYHTFNMATDQWVVTNQLIEDPTNRETHEWISIAVRSDGDIVVVYAGDTDQVMGGKKERVDVNVRTGGTWGGPVVLDAADDIHYGNPNCVKASGTDDIHIIFQQTTNTDDPPTAWENTHLRTIDPSNVLSTVVTNTEDTVAAINGIQNAVTWDDAGTERIRAVTADGTAGHVQRFKDDASNDITTDAAKIEYASSSHTPTVSSLVNNGTAIITMAIDPADDSLHVLWSNDDDTQDIWYSTSTDKGATWATEAEELNGVAIEKSISANIYIRGSDTVLAYVYGESSSTKYNEKVLTAGALDIAPTGIASTESFGTAVVTTGAVDISPTGIASAENIPNPLISIDITPTGIASAENVPSPVITTGATDISPTGIVSAEAFGTAVITTGAVDISPTSIASTETFGTAALTIDITPTGIASAEAFGTAVITTGAVDIIPTGIASTESFGAAVITTGVVDISPTSIASAEAFGAAVISQAQNLAPTGIASTEAFGTAVITTGAVDITPTGIVSAESFGTTIITVAQDIAPTGIASAEVVPAPALSIDITPTGIASAEAIPNPVITTGAVDISPTGIASTEAFGVAVITTGIFDIAPTGIASTESFGTAVITTGVVDISPTGIASAEAVSGPVITVGAVDIAPTSITSTETIPNPVVTTGAVDISPTGIASTEAFGTTVVDAGGLVQDLSPIGIPSAEVFGVLHVTPKFGNKRYILDGSNNARIAAELHAQILREDEELMIVIKIIGAYLL